MVLCVILLFKFKLSLMITYNHTGAITMKYIVILYLSVYHPWRENWPCGSVVAGFAYQVTGNTHLHNVTEIDTKPFLKKKSKAVLLNDSPMHPATLPTETAGCYLCWSKVQSLTAFLLGDTSRDLTGCNVVYLWQLVRLKHNELQNTKYLNVSDPEFEDLKLWIRSTKLRNVRNVSYNWSLHGTFLHPLN